MTSKFALYNSWHSEAQKALIVFLKEKGWRIKELPGLNNDGLDFYARKGEFIHGFEVKTFVEKTPGRLTLWFTKNNNRSFVDWYKNKAVTQIVVIDRNSYTVYIFSANRLRRIFEKKENLLERSTRKNIRVSLKIRNSALIKTVQLGKVTICPYVGRPVITSYRLPQR